MALGLRFPSPWPWEVVGAGTAGFVRFAGTGGTGGVDGCATAAAAAAVVVVAVAVAAGVVFSRFAEAALLSLFRRGVRRNLEVDEDD